MPLRLPTRAALITSAFALLLATPILAQSAPSKNPPPPPPPAHTQPNGAAPIERKPGNHPGKPPGNRPNEEHLNEWMNHHANLTLDQQKQALQAEPGFRELPPQTQQRMIDHLAELNAMSPERRQRILERNEAMEHLTPPQREQVRAAMKQLAELPPDQRRYVARTFRGLRELTPAQRQTVLNSERFAHLTDAQRSSLDSLMKVEPLLPPPYDATASAPPPAH